MVARRRLLASASASFMTAPFCALMAQPSPHADRIIVAGFRGTSVADSEVDQVLRYLEAGGLAGVVLLKRNITSSGATEDEALGDHRLARPAGVGVMMKRHGTPDADHRQPRRKSNMLRSAYCPTSSPTMQSRLLPSSGGRSLCLSRLRSST
jgi:hypothetical protein